MGTFICKNKLVEWRWLDETHFTPPNISNGEANFTSDRGVEDLRVGMELPGIVTNITAFGAFVDVGVKQDGLVHLSQMAHAYVSDPNTIVKLHQHIPRKRISLSMKL